jgi:methylmalonyl-CoA mutase
MAENRLQKLMSGSFPLSDKKIWQQTATSELDGNDPFTHLAWRDSDNIEFLPFYDHADVFSLDYLRNFHWLPAPDSFLGNRTWLNLPCITVTNELNNNNEALNHLSNGADGVLFDLKENASPDFNKLLETIQWQYCSLSFIGLKDDSFLIPLNSYLSKLQIDPLTISGSLFWDTNLQKRNFTFFSEFKNFKTGGCFISSSTPVKEICDALVTAVKYLDSVESDHLLDDEFRMISFSFPVNTRFLSEICKFKAFRLLWYQVAQAYNVKNYSPDEVHVHVRSESWSDEKFQPQGNLIKSTIAAMAAITGGCDSLTVYPEKENNAMMNRVARNVSNILREESHFDKVADPAAGSYAIEAMVDAIAQRAWTMFQSTLKK